MRYGSLLLVCIIFCLPCISCSGTGAAHNDVQQDEILRDDSGDTRELTDTKSDAYLHFAVSRINTYRRNLDEAIEQMELAVEQDPESSYLKYNLALLFMASDQNEKAVEQLRAAIDADPSYLPPYKVLGKLYATSERDDYREMTGDILRKAVELDPEDYESNLLLGVYYIDNNEYEKAKKYLRKSIEIKPSDIKSYFYLGEVLRDQGKLNEAKDIYSEILEIDTDNYSTLLTLAAIYEQTGDINGAETYYKGLMQNYPSNPLVYEEYGGFLYRTGRITESVIQFENAEILENNDTEIKLKLGILYLETGEYRKALNKLHYVLQQDPGNDAAVYYRGIAFLNIGETSAAQRIFESINPQSDYYVNSIIQLAILSEREGDTDRAVELLESGMEKFPENPGIVNYLGQIYRNKNDYSKAISIYEDYLGTHPDSQQIIYSLAVTYFYNDNVDKSVTLMKSILEKDPDNADALNFIGYTYAEMGVNLDEAERMIRKALKLSPDSGYIIDSLGWVYYKRGKYDQALELIKKAASISPDDATIKEHLGDIYLAKDQKLRALRSYREALDYLDGSKMELREKIRLENRLEEKIKNVFRLI